MSRFLAPLLCLGLAAASFVSLHSGSDEVFVLIGIDRLVGPDPRVQAAWSWKLFAAVGLVWGGVRLRAEPAGDAALDE